MLTSRMKIEPLSGLSSPMSDFRNTDLPVPDGPSSAETSPGGNVSVTSPQIRCFPKVLVRSVTATSTPTDPSPSPAPGRASCVPHPTCCPSRHRRRARVVHQAVQRAGYRSVTPEMNQPGHTVAHFLLDRERRCAPTVYPPVCHV